MKTYLFFAQDGVGGAERVMVTIANILADKGNNIRFILIRNKNSKSSSLSTLIEGRFKYERIIWRGQVQLLKELYRGIQKNNPEVIFASAMHINQRLLLLKPFFSGCKFIVRNDNYLYTLSKLKRITLKYIYPKADAIIGQTEEMGEELRRIGISSDKINVVRNPIDTDMINEKLKAPSPFDSDDQSVKFIGCGRFSHQKGFDILVKAFSIVKQSIPGAKLYLLGNLEYGDGAVRKTVENIVKENNLNDSVICTGHIDNPFKYIKHANVFVLSSRWEGLPNVLLESEYIGTPSAATKCIPVIERMIKEGENGFLAESENPQSLAEAMIKAVNIPHFNTTDGENREEWEKLFEKVVG